MKIVSLFLILFLWANLGLADEYVGTRTYVCPNCRSNAIIGIKDWNEYPEHYKLFCGCFDDFSKPVVPDNVQYYCPRCGYGIIQTVLGSNPPVYEFKCSNCNFIEKVFPKTIRIVIPE